PYTTLFRSLHVVATARATAHAAQREAAFVVEVDQLVRHRRHVGQQPEPAERINLLVQPEAIRRHAGAAHAVKTVAAGDEVAFDRVRLSAPPVAHARARAVEAVHA